MRGGALIDNRFYGASSDDDDDGYHIGYKPS